MGYLWYYNVPAEVWYCKHQGKFDRQTTELIVLLSYLNLLFFIDYVISYLPIIKAASLKFYN